MIAILGKFARALKEAPRCENSQPMGADYNASLLQPIRRDPLAARFYPSYCRSCECVQKLSQGANGYSQELKSTSVSLILQLEIRVLAKSSNICI